MTLQLLFDRWRHFQGLKAHGLNRVVKSSNEAQKRKSFVDSLSLCYLCVRVKTITTKLLHFSSPKALDNLLKRSNQKIGFPIQLQDRVTCAGVIVMYQSIALEFNSNIIPYFLRNAFANANNQWTYSTYLSHPSITNTIYQCSDQCQYENRFTIQNEHSIIVVGSFM